MSEAFTPHPLGFGSAPLGTLTDTLTEAVALETIQAAYDHGIRFLDTAPLYGNGTSEMLLGKVLNGVDRETIRISSKVGWEYAPGAENATHNFSRDGVLRSIEGSLKRLQTDYLDIAHIHDPDHEFAIARDETLPVLLDLKAQGVIRAIGSGMNQWEVLEKFRQTGHFDAFLLAGRYTLLEQGGHDFLERCADDGIEVIIGGVFNSGILAIGPVPGVWYNYAPAPEPILEKVRRIEAVCKAHDVPMIAAAMQFAAAHRGATRLALGARKPSEVEANIREFDRVIPAALWQQLKAESLIIDDAPLPA